MSGNLAVTPLMSLCSTIESNERSALIRLATELGPATLWFRQGTLVDAEFDGSVGDGALSRLMALDDGRFEVVLTEVSRPQVVQSSPSAVIQQRRARSAEWARLLDEGPSLNSVLEVDRSAVARTSLEPSQRALLQHFDGQRCVIDVIDQVGSDAVETLRDVVAMLRLGVLSVGTSYSEIPPSSGFTPEAAGAVPRAPAVPRFDLAPSDPRAEPTKAGTTRYSDRPGTVEFVNTSRVSSMPPTSAEAPSTERLGSLAPPPVELPRYREVARLDRKLGVATPLNVQEAAPDVTPAASSAVPPAAPKPMHGETKRELDRVFLDKYEVLCRLGRGGMGTVYLCRVTGAAGFRRLYALKVLRQRIPEGSAAERLFLTEAYAASRLAHPNVVSVIDANIHRGQAYLVLDYVEGCSLSTLLTRSPEHRPADLVATMMLDALNGLAAAHELTDDSGVALGLIHCDLSPENLLVGVDGACRLSDFGIARIRATDSWSRSGTASHGKAAYASPELIEGRHLDQRSDIFSMGVVFWNALTGRQLFLAPTQEEILHRVLTDEIPVPSRVGVRPPTAFDEVCARALARDPDQRFASAREMAEAIRRVAVHHDLLGSPNEISSWVRAVFGPELQQRRLASLDASRRAATADSPERTLPRALTIPPPPVVGSAEHPETAAKSALTASRDAEARLPDTERPEAPEPRWTSRVRNAVIVAAVAIAFGIIALSVAKPDIMARWFKIETLTELQRSTPPTPGSGAPGVELPWDPVPLESSAPGAAIPSARPEAPHDQSVQE